MPTLSSNTQAKSQHGGTLLETLIALLILSIGMLGIMKLQIESMRQTTDARFVIIAGAKAQSIMDAITYERKLNAGTATPFTDSSWGLSKGTAANSISGDTSAILKPWLTSVQGALPGGDASIACASNVCTITIFWSPGKTTQLDMTIINERSAKYVVQNPSA